ncbi:MAG: SDR family oxidoreductase [Proteobacteria bacterium]|nr:SDR family oxidoreductase [Pseudomonadota bacterium]
MRLQDKTALVTAAGAGIGRAIAFAFAREGARVTAVDIDAGALATLRGAEPLVKVETLDVTDRAAIAAMQAREPRFDILVNAVGYVHAGTILDCDELSWTRSLELNMTSMYRVIRAWLPDMVAGGGGAIVNIASVASSIRGVPNRFVYGATKAGVIGLTKAVAADFVAQGVRCNAICPGTVDSPSLAQRLRDTGDEAAARAAFVARQPMGRIGTPDEIAALAVYLASDEAAFTTGAIHVIDGGWTM